MSKKYQEIMDQVQMTDEMKQRILQNVRTGLEETENAQNPRAGKIISRKFFAYGKTSRYLSAAACIMMLIVGGLTVPKLINRGTIVDSGELGPGVASAESQGEASQEGPILGSALPGNEQQEGETGEQQAMIANGMIEVDSLQELSEALGFEVPEVKSIPFEVSSITYVNGWNEFAQVTYQGENQDVIFRMAKGTDDISGDYNAYPMVKTISVNGADVTLKCSGDTCELAIWQEGEFTYSLSFMPGGSEAVFTEMLQSLDKSEN